MCARRGKWNYILLGFFSLNIIFARIPAIGKSQTILSETNATIDTTFPHHTLSTDTCYIPNLYFSDTKKLTHFPNELKKCPNSEKRLLSSNRTHIWVVTSNLHHYANENSHFRCCYKSFQLSANVDLRHQGFDKTIRYHDCVIFYDSIKPNHEFVRVYCYYDRRIIYDQIFVFAFTKSVDTFSQTISGTSEAVFDQTRANNQRPYNVVILGMSSVSQRNFHRTMTKTNDVLKNIDVIDFLGYNKYANTKYANLIPIFAGKQVNSGTFIWDLFKEHGFYTALIEDTRTTGISFCDFADSPTDYYFKPLITESEEKNNLNYCTGDQYTYKILIDYILQLFDIMHDSKLFGIFWQSSMSNQGVNYPIATDADYANLFQTLIENGYLNRTIVILLSEHGSRYLSSKEGYLEERLPLFKIVLPPQFRNYFNVAYRNLILNSQRLITGFDVHATLADLVDLNGILDEELLVRSEKVQSSGQGISLFLPIPRTRNCGTLGLVRDNCICFERKKMYNIKGITASYVAKLIAPEINKILISYPQCLRVKLAELMQISKFSALHLKQNRFMEYLVRVRTSPAGIFQATVRFDSKWSVVSGISRIDYRESLSYCVDSPFVKLYCFCKFPKIFKLIMPETSI